AALPEIEKARGHVVIIGSVAGWTATPGTSAYAMSKFAMRALADSITPGLRLVGVKVTLISPGFVVGNIRRRDKQGAFHAASNDPVRAWLSMSTTTAARKMLKAVARGKRETIVTGHGKLLVALQRFAPWAIRAVAGPRTAKPHKEG